MNELNLAEEYNLFWDDVLREAEVSGEPQHSAFFQLYGGLAAENGDCADLIYTPIRKEGRGGFQVDGYSFDRDNGELHLAICDFRTELDLQSLNADRVQQMFVQVHRFCNLALDTSFLGDLEEASSAFELANQIYQNRTAIKRIRCILFSNAKLAMRKKTIEAGELIGVPVIFNIIDFNRFLDITRAQGGVEPIELFVNELNDGPLPCLKAHVGDSNYQSYLVVMPGNLLARIYGLYGARLMEQNVRTFLQARTKANKGIIATASAEPEMFFAYNNGITATATDISLETGKDGSIGISVIRNLQIVNGGQTTASLLYARDKNKADLSKVFVQMKLSVVESERVDDVVPLISRYANTQNRISEADFFSSHPFHVEMQQISRRLRAPVADGSLSATRWFYERARGQYKNEQSGKNPSEKRLFDAEFPRAQMIQKTDLAKYHMTFKAQPHLVSMGAQKCFINYAQEIGKKWESNKSQFNDAFFRNTVAKAILFRWTDSMIGKSVWYQSDRGYKANIVTYTLASLVNYLDVNHTASIDYEKIWMLQSVPEELQHVLIELAPRAAEIVKNPPASMRNISEYAKTQACWKLVSDYNFTPSQDLLDITVSLDEAKERSRDAVKNKKIDNDLEIERLIYGLIGKIDTIESLARSHRVISPLSLRAMQKIRNGNINLSKSEMNSMKLLFKNLKDRGNDVTDLLTTA